MNLHRRLLGAQQAGVPPLGGNSTNESYVYESNFDTNMVIILAALLCALLCALGLNSIVRCFLRCCGGESEEAGGVGLKKRALRQLPVAVYGSGVDIPATECPICLGEFVKGEKLRVLPKCNHGFHVRCIDTWLVSHSSCPNCRHSLIERPAPTQSAAGDHPPPPVVVVPVGGI